MLAERSSGSHIFSSSATASGGSSVPFTTRSRAWNDLTNRSRVALLAAASTAAAAVIAELSGARTRLEGWSLATAWVAFALLAVSLSLGPANVLRRRHNPVHMVLRRDFGVAGGLAALLHTVLGLQVHMGGVLARYFTMPDDAPEGRIFFVAANYAGLLSAIVLLLLVVISNDIAIRRLGLARWKKAQRLVYAAAAAAAAHGVLYQFQEKRVPWAITLLVMITLFVVALQLRGARMKRRLSAGRGSPARR